MKLYFSPLACSMASRIVAAETGRDVTFIEVDPFTKKTESGDDYRQIHRLGLVPALQTDDGLLTENIAVLWKLGAGTSLVPEDRADELRRWLAFISTELHVGVFTAIFDRKAHAEVHSHAVAKSTSRLEYLDEHLRDRDFLLDDFSVADAFLITVLNWVQATPIDLKPYPAIEAYRKRMLQRPSVKAALALELPLYLEEQKRVAAPRARA